MPSPYATGAYALGKMQAARKPVAIPRSEPNGKVSGITEPGWVPKCHDIKISSCSGVVTIHASDGRACAIGVARARLGLPARDLMLEFDPVPRRHAQKVSGPPDHVILEFGDGAVGIRQFPHHF